jgi:hypothetical protein
VFILKGVEVLCFDTDLQVFILKVLTRPTGGKVGRPAHTAPVFVWSAQAVENKA